jgi:hypothetical protein
MEQAIITVHWAPSFIHQYFVFAYHMGSRILPPGNLSQTQKKQATRRIAVYQWSNTANLDTQREKNQSQWYGRAWEARTTIDDYSSGFIYRFCCINTGCSSVW